MSYEKLIETTKWDDGVTPNHTYFRKGTVLVGYIKEGTEEYIPLNIKNFETRRRTFKKSRISKLPI